MIREFNYKTDFKRLSTDELDNIWYDAFLYGCCFVEDIKGKIKYVPAKSVRLKQSTNEYVIFPIK